MRGNGVPGPAGPGRPRAGESGLVVQKWGFPLHYHLYHYSDAMTIDSNFESVAVSTPLNVTTLSSSEDSMDVDF